MRPWQSSGAISPSTAQAVEAARASSQGSWQDLRSTLGSARQVLTPEQRDALRSTPLGLSHATGKGLGGGHGARRLLLARAVLSDAFLALVQGHAG